MAISTTVKQVYTGDGDQVEFTIPHWFVSGEQDTVVKVYLREEYRTFSQAAILDSTDKLNTENNFFTTGDEVTYDLVSGTAVGGLTDATKYYVIYIDNNNIKLATSKALAVAGTAIDISTAGTGSHKLTPTSPYESLLTLYSHYDYDASPPTQVIADVAPLTGQELIIIRESDLSQQYISYISTTPWTPTDFQTQMNRVYSILQEFDEKLSRSLLLAKGETGKDMTLPKAGANQVIAWDADGDSLVSADISIVQGPKGDTGARGEQGLKGDDGDRGIQGIQGPQGDPADIASQAEAEAGTENTKAMSALRVAQAIDDRVPGLGAITDIESDVTALQSADVTLNALLASQSARIAALEAASSASIIAGSHKIINSQAAADISGDGTPAASREPLILNSEREISGILEIEIRRTSDTEERLARYTYYTSFRNSTWEMEELHRVIVSGTDPGVTLSLNVLTATTTQVQYTSDTVGGTYDLDESRLKYTYNYIPKPQ